MCQLLWRSHTHTHTKRKGQPFFREFATKYILYFEQCSHKNSLILGWMFEAGPRSFRMMGGSEYINLRIHLCSLFCLLSLALPPTLPTPPRPAFPLWLRIPPYFSSITKFYISEHYRCICSFSYQLNQFSSASVGVPAHKAKVETGPIHNFFSTG